MRRLGQALLAVSLFTGCGGSELEPSAQSIARHQAPLTSTDVDVAPECQGIIDFVNTASLQTLDAYLPSYSSYANDPWSGNDVAIFVDTVNGFSLLTETYWSE